MFVVVWFFYRFFIRPGLWIVGILGLPFSRILRELLQCWLSFPKTLHDLAKRLYTLDTKDRIWIHASSIGEFESIRWMVIQLLEDPNKSILITYASPSLGQFIQRQEELTKHVRFMHIFFPLDSAHYLQKLRKVFQPTAFILLQYDFWPNLIKTIATPTPIAVRILLNFGATTSEGIIAQLKIQYTQLILDGFSLIHVCEESPPPPMSFPHLGHIISAPHTRWAMIKDIEQRSKIQIRPTMIPKVVGGNTHISDLPFLKSIFDVKPPIHYQLLWVPHLIDPPVIKKIHSQIQKLCHRYNIQFRVYETFEQISNDQQPGFILVVTFGILKYLYLGAQFAYIGGGFNTKGIHNLIEPISHGCPLISGPRVSRQPLAPWAVAKGYLKVGGTRSRSFDVIIDEYFDLQNTPNDIREKMIEDTQRFRKAVFKIPKQLNLKSS